MTDGAPERDVLAEPWPRPVLIGEGVLEGMKDDHGYPLQIEWGSPDADGFYTPTVSVRRSNFGLMTITTAWLAAHDAKVRAGAVAPWKALLARSTPHFHDDSTGCKVLAEVLAALPPETPK